MKKMYNQPKMEVSAVNTERMMQDMTMSSAGTGGGGATDAPARRGVGPEVPGGGL